MYKDLIKDKKVIIFDLDGTIVNTEPLWAKAFINVLKAHSMPHRIVLGISQGLVLEDKWDVIIDRLKPTENFTIAELSEQTTREFLDLLSETRELAVAEGFWELALDLRDKNLKIAIVTNSTKQVAEKILNKIGITNQFDLLLTRDDVENPKPNKEIYVKCAQMLEVEPKECLVFEDSVPGVQAAVKAKMDTAIIWDQETPKEYYPKWTLGFIPNFLPLVGTLDYTAAEEFNWMTMRIKAVTDKVKEQMRKKGTFGETETQSK